MLDDEWPDEPDEENPETRWGNPESDLPKVPVAPAPETAETDVDPELFKTFWAAVIFANVALFGLAVGPMVILFRGRWTLGLGLVAVGVFGAVRTWAYYASFRNRDRDRDGLPEAASAASDGGPNDDRDPEGDE